MHSFFLALPASGGVVGIGALGASARASQKHKCIARTCDAGHIPHNFNMLWCDAYNLRDEFGFTHFAMHHADITAEQGCLDILVDELERVDADILSVVIPVGDDRGVTSTGIHIPGTWNARRLTLTEAHELPETFSIEDTQWPRAWLALNTGLFMCRFDRPWVEDFPGFTLPTQILTYEGKKHAAQFPEDWGFSKWANERGLRVFATRKVRLIHTKPKAWSNDQPWGTWTEDEDAIEIPEELKHGNRLASSGCGVRG